jgi:hypothetical protein
VLKSPVGLATPRSINITFQVSCNDPASLLLPNKAPSHPILLVAPSTQTWQFLQIHYNQSKPTNKAHAAYRWTSSRTLQTVSTVQKPQGLGDTSSQMQFLQIHHNQSKPTNKAIRPIAGDTSSRTLQTVSTVQSTSSYTLTVSTDPRHTSGMHNYRNSANELKKAIDTSRNIGTSMYKLQCALPRL